MEWLLKLYGPIELCYSRGIRYLNSIILDMQGNEVQNVSAVDSVFCGSVFIKIARVYIHDIRWIFIQCKIYRAWELEYSRRKRRVFTQTIKKKWDFTVCQVKSAWICEAYILVRKVHTQCPILLGKKQTTQTGWWEINPRRFQLADAQPREGSSCGEGEKRNHRQKTASIKISGNHLGLFGD